MKIDERTCNTLEYDKVLLLLAACAPTAGARERALALLPDDDPDTVGKRLAATEDACRLLSDKGMPSFGMVKDPADAVERAAKGATLTMRELLDMGNLLRTSRGLLDYIRTNRHFETGLDVVFERLLPDRKLEDKIYRAIISEDMVADEASPALSDIRRKIRIANNRIKETLQHYITSNAYSRHLQEHIVTQRGGRYVIPVRVESKHEIKGLIHDTSSSGATIFVEPMAVVDAKALGMRREKALVGGFCTDINVILKIQIAELQQCGWGGNLLILLAKGLVYPRIMHVFSPFALNFSTNKVDSRKGV